MKSTISLTFNGNCADAIRCYERSLRGKITFELTWGASPMAGDVPPEWGTKICHSTLVIGDTTFHAIDAPPGAYEAPSGFSIVLDVDDLEEADRVVSELTAHGRVLVPPRETFWARRYAKVVDRFGIPWEINCANPSSGGAS